MESAIGINMCRCCASEGSYKDLNTKFTWMGETEIYADMLQYCFDINLEKEESDNGGICEVCITQLRHASNFKKQVLITEEKFKKRLQEKLFSRDAIKLEMNEVSIDSDNDNRVMDDFSEPEYDIPIKEEIEVEVKPKKRSAKASTSTTSRVKKPKNEEGEPSNKRDNNEMSRKIHEVTVSKHIKPEKPGIVVNEHNVVDWHVTISKQNIKPDLTKRSSRKTDLRENKILMDKHLQNVRAILLNTNATPVKYQEALNYHCHYCPVSYLNTKDLKRHTLEKHGDDEKMKFMKGAILSSYSCTLDITMFKCNLCDTSIATLELMVDHLIEHGVVMHKDINNHILTFRMEDDKFVCGNCLCSFNSLKNVTDHIKVHYKNYECVTCQATFVNKRSMGYHLPIHKIGNFSCSHCSKVFDTRRKLQVHEKYMHTGDRNRLKCPLCPQRFLGQSIKDDHMVNVHGMERKVFTCLACGKLFKNSSMLWKHKKKFHLMEKPHTCNVCESKFFSRRELTFHMLKHTGEKRFQCDVCSKHFARKWTLREHIRIHMDDRRFKCTNCGMTFVQKCSMKSHMLTKHGVAIVN